MRYHNLFTSIWEDEKFLSLHPLAKLLYIYLLSNPLCRISGVYKISLRRMYQDTDLPKVEDLLNMVVNSGLVVYDFKTSMMWVTGKIKYSTINYKHYEAIKSVSNDLEAAKGSHFYDYFFTKYPQFLDVALDLEAKKRERYSSKKTLEKETTV